MAYYAYLNITVRNWCFSRSLRELPCPQTGQVRAAASKLVAIIRCPFLNHIQNAIFFNSLKHDVKLNVT